MPDQLPVLALVSGLPGAGKTTYATGLEMRLQALRLCADEWLDELALDLWDDEARDRVERLQWDLARHLLPMGVSVVIEWGTWARSERDRIRDEARRLGAQVELHHLDAPVHVLHRRVTERGREQPAISRRQLEAWMQMFKAPTEDEARRWDTFQEIRSTTTAR